MAKLFYRLYTIPVAQPIGINSALPLLTVKQEIYLVPFNALTLLVG